VSYDAAYEELNRIESNYKLRDPETASAEVQRIVTEEMKLAGVDVDGMREKNRERAEQERKAIFAAAAKFKASRPETDPVNGFLACDANKTVMLESVLSKLAENSLLTYSK
jgi:hypothetical protein